MSQKGRGCVKSRRKNTNDLTDENFSRFFYFRSTSDLENKPRSASCENSVEFLHSLGGILPFGDRDANGKNAQIAPIRRRLAERVNSDSKRAFLFGPGTDGCAQSGLWEGLWWVVVGCRSRVEGN
jgi:hypothetical protein